MENTNTENLIYEANEIIRRGEDANTTLRLIGGLAIRMTSPSSKTQPKLLRSYADIDFVGLEKDGRTIQDVFLKLGYKADERFNALHGRTRLIFYNPQTKMHIDIFLDRFEMCHKIDLRKRLLAGYKTIPLSDLLATKLQIIEINSKDMVDIITLLLDHDLSREETADNIDIQYLAGLVCRDWGLYTTLTDNLAKTKQQISEYLSAENETTVSRRITEMIAEMVQIPKTTPWKIRAKIGRKMEWYELPDEVNR